MVMAVITVATGFAALSLFSGYTENVYQGMQQQAIYGEMLGHMTLFKPGLHEQGLLHPERWLLSPQDIDAARAAVAKVEAKARLLPRMTFNGVISNGKVSTIFIAEALNPEDMRIVRGPMADASGALEAEVPNGISVSNTLAILLEAKYQSDLSLLGSTIRGQTNAIDAVVTDTYDTGNVATNDKSLYVPLEQARSLLDAPGMADRLTVMLDDIKRVDELLPLISAELQRAGSPLTVHSWHQDAAAYRQVKIMFDLIFAFMFVILLVICVMALTNVVSMNVIERAREIGALRALGMRQVTVERLFATEALLLIVLGCAAGLVAALLIRYGINSAGLGFIPPNSTNRVPLTVGIDVVRQVQVVMFFCLFGTVAGWWIARRAARQPIIDLLGHV
jgi:putative ABC transport system permease protein